MVQEDQVSTRLDTTTQIQKFNEFFELHYQAEILESLRKGNNFFYVNFNLLSKFDPELSELLLEQPEEVLKAAEMGLDGFDIPETIKSVKIRVHNLPKSQKIMIRNLRSNHLGKLIVIEGIVRQKSDVRPQVTSAKFECPSCGNIIHTLQPSTKFNEPSMCGCGRKGKFRLVSKELMDVQSITLEEVPEDLEGGAQPKKMKVFLQKDLVSPLSEKKTNPGTRIIVVGQLKDIPITLRSGGQSTRYDLMIEANSVETSHEDFSDIKISDEDLEKIKELSSDPKGYYRLIHSIVPSIYGHEKIKEALLLQLMSGVKKPRDDGVFTRGDIHILLIGDPGSGKSMILKRVDVIAPKSRFISGKGASGAGLCVAPDSLVMRNPSGPCEIKGMVEEKLSHNQEQYCEGVWRTKGMDSNDKIMSMDPSLKLTPKYIDHFWKLKSPEIMVELLTESGKRICLTKNTKLFTNLGKNPAWKKSGVLKIGEYVATAGDKRKVIASKKKAPKTKETPDYGTDVLWDKVIEKRLVNPDYEYVYDLTVKDSHNFLVNGFVVHNTASVVKDEFLQGWSLEAGALVLANKGLCAIDELDKMSKEDTSAMHEALEGQTVTISKANIQATLRCETTVLAAANPKYGRFDPYSTIAEQITLPSTLINRFDLIFPIKDLPDQIKDEKMATFVLNLHQNIFPDAPELDTQFIRKYIAYAKQNIKPTLSDGAIKEIKKYYLKMRESGGGEKSMKTIPISARQLEGLIRLSEAVAKTRLSEKVTVADTKKAISLLDYCLRQIAFDEETGSFDIDMVATGVKASQRNKIVVIKEVIAELEEKLGKVIPIEDITSLAEEKNIDSNDVEEVIEKLRRTGDIFEPKRGFISRI